MKSGIYQLKFDKAFCRCPHCGHDRYKRYINTSTNEFDLPYHVGRCERINSCGWFYRATDYLQQNTVERTFEQKTFERPKPPPPPIPTFAEPDLVRRSLADFGAKANVFTDYLRRIFGDRLTLNLIERFHIGTASNWQNSTGKNSTIFWQIDDEQNTRGGKIMLYDENGRRRKDGKYIIWHYRTRRGFTQNYTLVQCLFGLHQLETESETKTVAIVESEKTAVIMTAIKPDLIWLATGGVYGAKPHECEALHGRNVILFADLGAEEIWGEYAAECRKNGIRAYLKNWHVATETENGLDIADFLDESDFSDARSLDFLTIAGGKCAEMWRALAKQYNDRQFTEMECAQIWAITDTLHANITESNFDTALRQVYADIRRVLDNNIKHLHQHKLREVA